MSTFLDAFRNLRGRTLEGFAHMPMLCDTPGVVADLQRPALWYSGAACLCFKDEPDLLLTWDQVREEFELVVAPLSSWNRCSLDRVHKSPEEPWEGLHNATLRAVSTFALARRPGDEVVAAKFDFTGPLGDVSLWVAIANDHSHEVGDGDDLYVALDPPPNVAALRVLETM